ncbi:NUDIX hydrolase [Nocardioides sp.]|uniref:NUDIX hydrolase n=1 Tax=Nocardioides sp. TaxID=35761 RepID=UPI002D7EC16D|nr:NUDIX hydrolase [Nocardioides sp.]HET8960626.1 NUDIX hydrolase [Nocardioides sp.]
MATPTPEPAPGDSDESWPVVESTDLFRDDWVMALRADRVRRPGDPGGESFRRLVLEHPGAAVVLALDEDQRVLCLRQYRHAARRRFVELPAGLCDVDGEDPLEVARRELREEAGLAAEDWVALTSAYSSPGISSELMHFFLARNLAPVDRGDFEPEHEEADMETLWVDFDDLLAAALDGRVSDAPIVLAVLLVKALGYAGPERPGE